MRVRRHTGRVHTQNSACMRGRRRKKMMLLRAASKNEGETDPSGRRVRGEVYCLLGRGEGEREECIVVAPCDENNQWAAGEGGKGGKGVRFAEC